jgi:hypothetical protein
MNIAARNGVVNEATPRWRAWRARDAGRFAYPVLDVASLDELCVLG